METKIPVKLPENAYEIVIKTSGLSSLGDYLTPLKLGKKIIVVSNPEIFNFYGKTVLNSLETAGFEVFTHLIPPGEQFKTLSQIEKVYDTAFNHRLERSSTLLALGGGVIGDLTGFAAATWLRGINFIQVPTSLLAMVDASVGGKTGVNHPLGKNLIGAFYQPKLVFIDPEVLKTLPEREFRAGMAEVIKYGVIWDENLFAQLEQCDCLESYSKISPELLETILTRSCQAKADVVGQDERESGLRAILNYGHTVGHTIESLTNYSSVNHGEAVAMGMAIAGAIAISLNLWTKEEGDRQNQLIIKTGLPTEIPAGLNSEEIINLLSADKKVKDGKVRFILPTKIGKVIITSEVSNDIIRQVLRP
jgi:3-dehydroquinate synthase